MTGAYVRINRKGKWKNVEIEHLTETELDVFLENADKEECMKWLKFYHGVIGQLLPYFED